MALVHQPSSMKLFDDRPPLAQLTYFASGRSIFSKPGPQPELGCTVESPTRTMVIGRSAGWDVGCARTGIDHSTKRAIIDPIVRLLVMRGSLYHDAPHHWVHMSR